MCYARSGDACLVENDPVEKGKNTRRDGTERTKVKCRCMNVVQKATIPDPLNIDVL